MFIYKEKWMFEIITQKNTYEFWTVNAHEKLVWVKIRWYILQRCVSFAHLSTQYLLIKCDKVLLKHFINAFIQTSFLGRALDKILAFINTFGATFD